MSVNTYPQTILSSTIQQNPNSIQPSLQSSCAQQTPAPTSNGQQIKSSSSPTLNNNAQAALWILLTAQMQSQTGESSILQNPQVVNILQNLVSQAGNPDGGKNATNGDTGTNNLNEVLSHPALSSVFNSTGVGSSSITMQPQINWQGAVNGDVTQSNEDSSSVNTMLSQQQQRQAINSQQQQQALMAQQQRTTLLDTPKRPSLLGQAPPTTTFQNISQQSHALSAPSCSTASVVSAVNNSHNDSMTTPTAIIPNNLSNLLNAQNLSQLLGSITGEPQKCNNSTSTDLNTMSRPSTAQRPVLLNNPPSQNSNASQPPCSMSNGMLMGGYHATPTQSQQGGPQNQHIPMANPPPPVQISQLAHTTPSMLSNMSSVPQPSITTPSMSISNQMVNHTSADNFMSMMPPQSAATAQNPFLLSGGYNMAIPPTGTTVSQIGASPAFVYGAPQMQPFGSNAVVTSNGIPGAQSLYGSYVPISSVQVQPSSAQIPFGSTSIGAAPTSLLGQFGSHQAFSIPSMGMQPSNITNTLMPPQNNSMMNPQIYPSTPPNQQMQSPSNPGCGLKRKLPIPPSPENSPDGPFIGQHSQGLGGHYADSYFNRSRSPYSNKRQRF